MADDVVAPSDSFGRRISDPNVAAYLARNGGLTVRVGQQVMLPRSWRERLFSRPWRPWVATMLSARRPAPDECLWLGRALYMGEAFHARMVTFIEGRTPSPQN